MKRPSKRRSALIGVALAAVVGTVQPAIAATATDAGDQTTALRHSPVHDVEDGIARSLSSSLLNREWRAKVRAAALGTQEVDLQALAGKAGDPAGRRLQASVSAADRHIAALKGLPASTCSLLRIRLGAPAMRPHLSADATPWVAVAAADDHARTITAYDSQGRAHAVDTTRVPERPLYVLDIDVSKAHRVGLTVLRQALADKGLAAQPTESASTADAAGWWATKVTAVAVQDDQEPWFKGGAEMFSLVTGFGLDGKARVDSVDMPYLDYDGTTYYPNQILVNWSNYKYNLADVVMMEDDDGTNYKALAQALTTALLTVTDQGTYIPLVNAVLSAMPDSWFTDDPDYVESWYTLSKNSTGRLNGAAGNGWMTVEPYFVEQF
ncbi:hypothetical protein GCM10011579_082780 [Streptomyces albiflavescens]|uniref:DUF3103 domain-containing protein n=1 Tax=Streptomyces albiflavescens TaxID=1623582 RepID=A0A918D9M9_9ACTN|nr:DUF3103 family protein [Streptomyces albiflavescens]GGN88764.1 hypothetical protein GCM10011579_082780 [Streptomyces albiflavescens]